MFEKIMTILARLIFFGSVAAAIALVIFSPDNPRVAQVGAVKAAEESVQQGEKILSFARKYNVKVERAVRRDDLINEVDFEKFIDEAARNERLQRALTKTAQAGIMIIIDDHFRMRYKEIHINIKRTPVEEVIAYLCGPEKCSEV